MTTDFGEKELRGIASQISSGPLLFAIHRPETWATQTYCFANVLRKVETSGGRELAGWTFHHRISADFGGYVFAAHHGVWLAPDDSVVDVTPFNDDPLHHPLAVEGNVIFLADEGARPVQIRGGNKLALAPLPSRFFAIEKNTPIERYVLELNEREQRQCEQDRVEIRRMMESC